MATIEELLEVLGLADNNIVVFVAPRVVVSYHSPSGA